MPKSVLVLLAEGFEEVEAVTPIDYLRRAGIEVTVAGIGNTQLVSSARGLKVTADAIMSGLAGEGKLSPAAWDAVIVPGGLPGSDNLAASKEVGAFLIEMAREGKFLCAICAAPARVLSPLGLLAGKRFTCYPGEEDKVLAPSSASAGAIWKEDRVVVDGNIITSRGAGSAGEFSCAIINSLLSRTDTESLAEKVLLSV